MEESMSKTYEIPKTGSQMDSNYNSRNYQIQRGNYSPSMMYQPMSSLYPLRR